MAYKVIIAGGRDFSDFERLVERCDFFLSKRLLAEEVTVVSGLARGADELGIKYANMRGLEVAKFPANWEKHNSSTGKNPAGMIRNREMAEYADALIVFWDGKSRGTRNMMETMERMEKPVRLVYYSLTQEEVPPANGL